MATNFHPDLPNDQIHNPKDFSEANNSSVLTRSGTGLLDWNTSPYGTSTTVTCGADVSGGLHNTTFFVFLNAANKAECHFNVSGETAVFVPTPAFFQIVIDIAPNDSAITVAAAIKTEFDSQVTNPFAALTTTVNGTGKVTFSGMTNSPDTIDGNTNFTFDNVKTYTGTTVLTSTTGVLSWETAAAGGGVSSIIAGTNTTISPVSGLGDVTINADNGLNGGNSKLKIYGGVCINTAGTWSLLNDASHTFLNFTSATTTSNRLRVNYPTVGKVISFICTPDETYAANGISVGASVGLSHSTLYLYRDNIVDYVYWNGSAFQSTTGQVTSFQYAAGEIKLNHGTLISPDTFSLGIEGRAGTTTNYRYAWTSLGASSTFIQVLNPDGTEYTGAATTDMRFSFNRGGEVEIDAADSAISSSNIWVQAIMEMN
tara:strand:- start:6141 stop:7424 length:1284 start_codon:yes stop_codon:yes gene_type:complete